MTTALTKSFPQEKPPAAMAVPGKKRVLIVGGGFAGIAAARALKRADVEITLIDRRNHHIFQPLLYQVATAVLSPSEIAAPIRQLEAKQKNLSVLLAEVRGINLGAHTVEAACPGIGSRKLEYDFLVVATGMRPSYFGHDEFARFAPGLKSLSDAEAIRTRILGAFELAESTDDEKERARQLTFVLVGAGPTGVRARCFDRSAGLGDPAQEFPQDRSCQEPDSVAGRRRSHSADFCRVAVTKGSQAANQPRG